MMNSLSFVVRRSGISEAFSSFSYSTFSSSFTIMASKACAQMLRSSTELVQRIIT